MKRVLSLVLAVAISLSLCACGNVSTSFEKAIEKGDWGKALELFQDKICTNEEKRTHACQFLQQYLTNTVADFNDGKIDYDKARSEVKTVAEIGAISDVAISDTFGELSALQESKAAYDAAMSLFDEEMYMDALYNFRNVVVEDSNYLDAQAGIAAILMSVINDLTYDVKALCEKREFRQALDTIDETASVAGISTEIETLRKEIVAKYIDYSLTEAKKAFAAGTDGKDYTAAAAIIVATLDDVGEDARLIAALEDYESYEPVYLVELDYFDKDGFYYSEDGGKDSLGNEHQNYVYLADGSSKELYVTYYLGGDYSRFSGVCALKFDYRTSDKTTVYEVYGDDKLLFTSNSMTKGVAPQEFSVNVLNTTYLKIVVKFSSPNTRSTGIFDAVLTK